MLSLNSPRCSIWKVSCRTAGRVEPWFWLILTCMELFMRPAPSRHCVHIHVFPWQSFWRRTLMLPQSMEKKKRAAQGCGSPRGHSAHERQDLNSSHASCRHHWTICLQHWTETKALGEQVEKGLESGHRCHWPCKPAALERGERCDM